MRKIDEEGKYRYLEHSAAVKIHGQGEGLQDAFANTALGMVNLITDTNNVTESETKFVSIKAPKITELLYDFLNKVLDEIEANHFIPKEISNVKLGQSPDKKNFLLVCQLIGQSQVEDARDHGIKGATYSEMCLELDEQTGHYHIHVVIDA